MGSKTRLSSYCTKRANNSVNFVTSRNVNTRLARPIGGDRLQSDMLGFCPTIGCNVRLLLRDYRENLIRRSGSEIETIGGK